MLSLQKCWLINRWISFVFSFLCIIGTFCQILLSRKGCLLWIGTWIKTFFILAYPPRRKLQENLKTWKKYSATKNVKNKTKKLRWRYYRLIVSSLVEFYISTSENSRIWKSKFYWIESKFTRAGILAFRSTVSIYFRFDCFKFGTFVISKF